jgi:hypothetical protein
MGVFVGALRSCLRMCMHKGGYFLFYFVIDLHDFVVVMEVRFVCVRVCVCVCVCVCGVCLPFHFQ